MPWAYQISYILVGRPDVMMYQHQAAGYLVWKSKHIGTLSLFPTPTPFLFDF